MSARDFEICFFPIPDRLPGERPDAGLTSDEIRFIQEGAAKLARRKPPFDMILSHDSWSCVQASDCLHDRLKKKLRVAALAPSMVLEKDVLPHLGSGGSILIVAPSAMAQAWFRERSLPAFALSGPWKLTVVGNGS
jgi:hypothetical protein